MLEIGAFHPAWGNIHLGPENALAAHTLLGGGPLLPIHWGTFNLALHPWDEPVETLLRLAPKGGARLLLPRLGEPIEPAHEIPLEMPGGAAWMRRPAAAASHGGAAQRKCPGRSTEANSAGLLSRRAQRAALVGDALS